MSDMSEFDKISGEAAAEAAAGPKKGFLYKYCRVDTAVKIFQSCCVLLDSVNNFNDPFEGRAILNWPDDDVLRRHIKATHPQNQWREMYEEAIRRKSKCPDEFAPEAVESINKVGISCFSEIRDNLLMWGHYADKHQGVCIGFRYRKIYDNLIARFRETGVACMPSKVVYSDKFPVWDIASGNHGKDVLNSKARCWEYEQEWRIAALDTAGESLSLPKEAFSHVIFGAKSLDKDQARLFDLITARQYDDMIFQRAKIADREYKVEIVPWHP